MPARIYTIANRKGGTGKTSTTGALASGITRQGYKVLVVDMDSQGDISDWSGVLVDDDMNTMFEVLTKQCKTQDAIIHLERYDILPADATLSLAGAALNNKKYKEDRMSALASRLEEVKEKYDFIFIDTPPSLDFLVTSSLIAADGGVIIVTDAGRFSTKGLSELAELINKVKEKANPKLRICGILINKFNGKLNSVTEGEKLTKRFSKFINGKVYETKIRFSIDIPMAEQESVDIFNIKRKNVGVKDFKAFVEEFLETEGFKNE